MPVGERQCTSLEVFVALWIEPGVEVRMRLLVVASASTPGGAFCAGSVCLVSGS